jgi:integrase
MIRHNLSPFFGKLELSRINLSVVEDFAANMREEEYAADSINNRLALLKKLLRDAVARELLSSMPVRGRWPREKTVQLRLELSREEQLAFEESFDNLEGFIRVLAEKRPVSLKSPSRFYSSPRRFGGGRIADGEAAKLEFQRFSASKPLFIVALESGISKSDLLGLRWSSVDFKNGWIRIDRGKTRMPALIPLSRKCRQALTECRKKRVISEFVFVAESLRPYSTKTIQRYFRRAKAIARIDRRFRFHDLRHTFGSNLASAGVSLQVIARCLGHSTTKMAERYARPNEESLRAVVSALDQEFKSRSNPAIKTTRDDSG